MKIYQDKDNKLRKTFENGHVITHHDNGVSIVETDSPVVDNSVLDCFLSFIVFLFIAGLITGNILCLIYGVSQLIGSL